MKGYNKLPAGKMQTCTMTVLYRFHTQTTSDGELKRIQNVLEAFTDSSL